MSKQEKIFVVILVVVLVIGIICSNLFPKKAKRHKGVVTDEPISTEFLYDEVGGNPDDEDDEEDEEDEDEDIDNTDMDSDNGDEIVTEEITTEIATEATTVEEYGISDEQDAPEGSVLHEDLASQTPVANSEEDSKAYWANWAASKGAEDYLDFDESFIPEIIEGILRGNIYGASFTTSTFTTVYKNGFFADVQDVVISDMNYESRTCTATITFTDSTTKVYSVQYEMNDENVNISDLICSEVG